MQSQVGFIGLADQVLQGDVLPGIAGLWSGESGGAPAAQFGVGHVDGDLLSPRAVTSDRFAIPYRRPLDCFVAIAPRNDNGRYRSSQ